MTEKKMDALRDSFGRTIGYLRISVTDRCNLRCLYCMPAWGCPFKPQEQILSYEEILRVAGIMSGLGVKRFRITGGEPLLRRDLVKLVAGLAAIPGAEDLALSTNGILLAEQAFALKSAGLRRVNVSLDSLDQATFRQITRLGNWQRVWQGIWTALEVGLSPVKLNVVLLKGLNDSEILHFAKLTLLHPLHVRFIELMPHGIGGLDHETHFLSAGEAYSTCEQLGFLEPASDVAGVGPAASFRYPGAKGTLGFIGALSCSFCDRCNRMRLTADGFLRPCLDNSLGVNLKDPLRHGASEEELECFIREAVAMKPESHTMKIGGSQMEWEPMCAIGG